MKQVLTFTRTLARCAAAIGISGMRIARERFKLLLTSAIILTGTGLISFAETTYTYDTHHSDLPAIPPGYTGIGPVISGTVDYSSIPGKARKFLEKNCDGHAIVKCNKEFTSGEFELRLADGIEMEFDPKGNIIGIEAPDGYSLSPTLLKAVVPGKLFNLLKHNGFQSSVESVNHDRSGYRIGISDPVFNEVCYDTSGVLTLIVNK